MLITSIRLNNYRNYTNILIKPDPNINIITGPNGSGKTNILESVIVSSNTKSFRTSDDSALIKHNEDYARIEIVADGNTYRVVLNSNGKSLFVNDEIISRTSNFIGRINAILFKPSDLEFFNSSPRERRKLIDLELGKINKTYLNALLKFNKLIKDKNRLLKENSIDDVYLNLINEQMVPCIEILIQEREKFFNYVNGCIGEIYRQISNQEIEIKAVYKKNIDGDTLKILNSSKEKDLNYHYAVMGPHHDDYYFLFNHHELSEIASQGQIRMTLISFKFALVRYINEICGIKPIILLDDVLSELDQENKRRLINFLPEDHQIIITDTNGDSLLNVKKHKLIRLQGGLNG
ncbi:MAG: DNA replication/repair protein RecF [Erysipelotrichaceae bacterium]